MMVDRYVRLDVRGTKVMHVFDRLSLLKDELVHLGWKREGKLSRQT